ncbi:MAG: redoxin family protein [Pirellulales bacterium]
MKTFNLLFAFSFLFFQLGIIQAEDTSDLLKAPELMAKLKENSNDTKSMIAFGNANFSAVMSLISTDPDKAEKYLDAIGAFYDSLEPEEAEAKQWKSRAASAIKSFKHRIKIARISVEELKARLEKDPDDSEAISYYSQKVMSELNSEARANPEEAAVKLIKVEEYLKTLSEKSEKEATKTAIALATRSLSGIRRTIGSQLKLLELIGKDTIPLGIDQWTNGAPIIDAELKGKVVLLDFWAVWCGPCVATFPHLVEWNKEYADDGLVILGLTRFYGYKWDEETEKAVRSKEDVKPEEELVALEKFAQSHNLKHRIGIQPKNNRLSEYFAVSGIPHVVLIDRQGKIQMVKVGSGEANAKALDAKIKELLAE